MDAFDICKAGGLNLREWQADIIDDWLGRKSTGRWAAKTCGLSVPRQNGKTLVVVARCAYGALALGEDIIYTSHLQKTSTETFTELRDLFETKAFSKYVKDGGIKTALGREEIDLKNGARIKFLARTRNGGRGQHGDLLIFDEAQELTDEQQGSFLPAISASANPQTIYTGTPPDESADGTVFTRIRKDALGGETTTTAWAEWSVTEIGDVRDRERWAEANPSFGIGIQPETIEGECEQMANDKFARERLGWWSDRHNRDTVIPESEWNGCKAEPPADGLIVYAVKFAVDGSVGSIAVCMKPTDGLPYIELIETRALNGGITWFVDWIAQRHTKAAQIVIDGGGNAQTLNERLLQSGVKQREIIRPKSSDIASACASLVSAVHEQRIAHMGQEQLDASATKTERRRIGTNGGYGFASTEDADATAIEACALAYWQAQITRRNPTRQIEVW